VPQNAGVLSAYGLLASDFTQYETVTRKVPVDASAPDVVTSVFREMEKAMSERFRSFGMKGEIQFSRTLQMRFVGQAFEVDVPAPQAITEKTLREAFDEAHRLVYFHSGGAGLAGKRVEIVGLRMGASLPETCLLPGKPASAKKPVRREPVYENKERRDCTVCHRSDLESGMGGPLLVEDDTSTIYVPPGWRAVNDAAGNLIVNRLRDTR
jgi:N-methylhydantoinase A